MSSESIDITKENQIELLEIGDKSVTGILSCSMSLGCKKSLICTLSGFCLVNNSKKLMQRFENKDSPFGSQNPGVSLGSVVEERTDVALVPFLNCKRYKKTAVYIYDYKIKDILYEKSFNLPIRQLTLTDDSLVVANNKRILIYDYRKNSKEPKGHKDYLDMYESHSRNETLRYLDMGCEEKLHNNSIPGPDEEAQEGPGGAESAAKESIEDMLADNSCRCGRYEVSQTKPLKLLYVRVFVINGCRRISLCIYDWTIDKSYMLESFEDQGLFSFCISGDGKFVCYTENEGCNAKVVALGQSGVYCTLRISRSLKTPLCSRFLLIKGHLWYMVIRYGGKSEATLHLFKVEAKKEDSYIESQYKRTFSLWEKALVEIQVQSRQIVLPYVDNNVVECLSASGLFYQMIDYKVTGNRSKKKIDSFLKWTEVDP